MALEKALQSSLDCKEIKPVIPKGNQSWIFIGRTDAEAEAPVLWPPNVKSQLTWEDSCWERLNAKGEGDGRGWDGWMASLTQWTWVWASSGRWWRTGKPSLLQSMGLHRVGHNWVTEQEQIVRVIHFRCTVWCVLTDVCSCVAVTTDKAQNIANADSLRGLHTGRGNERRGSLGPSLETYSTSNFHGGPPRRFSFHVLSQVISSISISLIPGLWWLPHSCILNSRPDMPT